MSTPAFDLALLAYTPNKGYEEVRKLHQALDSDRGYATPLSDLVDALVRKLQAAAPKANYVQVEEPKTGDPLPDLGHTTCTAGDGEVISLEAGKVPPYSGHAQESQQESEDAWAAVAVTGEEEPAALGTGRAIGSLDLEKEDAVPENYCAESVQKMTEEEARAVRPSAFFPNAYGIPPAEMEKLRDVVTVFRAGKIPEVLGSPFAWAVPPDAADILEATGKFRRLRLPPLTMTCIPKEKP